MRHPQSSRGLAFARARRAARDWVDPYRPVGKLYPAVCQKCGATEWQGRWRWDDPLPDLPRVTCPACERIRDGVPAHVLELTGALPPWWNEVRGLIGNVERAEVVEHPLERVMRVEVRDDRVLVPTTGMHIARRLVAAIVRRFRRQVRLQFGEQSTTIDWAESR
ncbi:MAG: ATPase [Planctomycetes bacterium]|nr:ATPase [Planctomycetota bacterium]